MAETAVPVVFADYLPLPSGTDQYTDAFIKKNEAVVLSLGNPLVVGLCDVSNKALQRQIEKYHGASNPQASVHFVRIEKNEFLLYLGKKSRSKADEAAGTDTTALDDGVYLDKIANDAPIVNLVNSLVLQAYNEGASDIHFDAQEQGMLVRFRVDGVLRTVETIRRDQLMAVSSRIKVMAQLNIMERRLPQDGRCSVQLGAVGYDIRVSVLPSIYGESIVLRLLPKDSGANDVGSLGFASTDVQNLHLLLNRPHGLFLVTGPTGSGKTTTLHALLRDLPIEVLKIITLEDPVEYHINGITQVQVNEAIGLGFDACLRRVLRQDPDVIMVGEIRDQATAELAIRASLTGHLVVSSLHTNTALDAITRMSNLGVEPYLVSAVLRGIVGQRLVRKLCPHCREITPIRDTDGLLLQALGVQISQAAYPVGCKECHGTGYAGRTLTYELLVPDKVLLERIARDPTTITEDDCQRMCGFSPMRYHALGLLEQGLTSIAEINRVVYS